MAERQAGSVSGRSRTALNARPTTNYMCQDFANSATTPPENVIQKHHQSIQNHFSDALKAETVQKEKPHVGLEPTASRLLVV
jgi:hypothetical protein